MPRLLLLCLFFQSALLVPASAAPPRTWTSKDGTATLTAAFHKVDGDNIVLILPNGRSQTIAKTFLSEPDLAWIAENTAAAPVATAPTAEATAAIPAALKGHLIDARGRPFRLAKDGAIPKFYLFYYSASWCPPCRAFTPELVRFANRLKNASFTVILVSDDHSLADEIAYLKDYDMPWPGIKVGSRLDGIPGNPGNGIPAARLTDADGKTLLTTEDTSRRKFLDEVHQILDREGALAPAGEASVPVTPAARRAAP